MVQGTEFQVQGSWCRVVWTQPIVSGALSCLLGVGCGV
jgi:hypothetical protein